MHRLRRLAAWRRAHALAVFVHETTARLTSARYPLLVRRIRESAIAVPERIAEGLSEGSPARFAATLGSAIAVARRLGYETLLARDLGDIGSSDFARLDARVDEVARMLVSLRHRLLEQCRAADGPPAEWRDRGPSVGHDSARPAPRLL